MRILVVEDEPNVRKLMLLYLRQTGYAAIEASNCHEALTQWREQHPDLILLDLNLPDGDGATVCTAVRNESATPVIMTTARVEEIDELQGLGLGADDYLKKPFSPAVLLARVELVLRRHHHGPVRFGSLHLDPVRQQAYDGDQKLDLTTQQFQLLALLAGQPDRIFTRREILDHLGIEGEVYDRSVDAYIKVIRKKLVRKTNIQTIYGRGYVFRPTAPTASDQLAAR